MELYGTGKVNFKRVFHFDGSKNRSGQRTFKPKKSGILLKAMLLNAEKSIDNEKQMIKKELKEQLNATKEGLQREIKEIAKH
jgi:hypothetical protein